MPQNKLNLSDLAIDQIQEIFEFHESQKAGKGSNFLEALWDCLEAIQLAPHRWQYLGNKSDNIRRAITKFPQSIILYDFEDQEVTVYEVYDSHQDWRRKWEQ